MIGEVQEWMGHFLDRTDLLVSTDPPLTIDHHRQGLTDIQISGSMEEE
jgi:hypothetical protein